MTKHYLLSIFCAFLSIAGFSQTNYSGNGNTGFGGPVGQSSMTISDDGTDITFNFTKGGGDFNDVLVIYISTGATGRALIDSDVNDNQDQLRTAISNGDSGGFASTLTFPAGFEATHAIAVAAGGINFGGLWGIPSTGTIGNNGLNYIDTANSTLTANNQPSFTMSISWSELGLTNTDSFDFVALYLSTTAYNSNEGYGDGISPTSEGGDAVTYTSAETYASTLGLNDVFESSSVFYTNNALHLSGQLGQTDIMVYDVYGRRVYQGQESIQGTVRKSLPLAENVVHFVVLETENKRKTFKVIPH